MGLCIIIKNKKSFVFYTFIFLRSSGFWALLDIAHCSSALGRNLIRSFSDGRNANILGEEEEMLFLWQYLCNFSYNSDSF